MTDSWKGVMKTNVLKHTNERAETLEYITYKEMEN